MIKLVGVEKTFGRQPVLRGVDLTIPAGKLTTIIGGTLAEGTLLSNAMSANEFLMRLETMGTSLPEAAPRQAE